MVVQGVFSTIIWKPYVYFATNAHTEGAFTAWTFPKASNVCRPAFPLIADTT